MGIIARQTIKGTIVTYIGVAVGFVTTFFVLTRFLSAEEIGLARVLIDAATLFVGLAQLGTTSSIIRFYPYFREQVNDNRGLYSSTSDHGFWFWTLVVPFVGFALFTAFYCVCQAPLAAWFGEKSQLFVQYYYFVVPMAFCMLYQTIFETGSNVLMRIVVPRAVRELIVRIGLLICYLLYAFHILSIDGFVLALVLNYAVAALINMSYLLAQSRQQGISWRPDWQFVRDNRKLVRNYLTYTGFLIISALAGVLAPTLSSFFITAKMGLDYTGIFAIATYIAVMVSIPYRSLTAIAAPMLASSIKEEQHAQTAQLMQRVAGNTMLVGTLILLAIWINIDLIFYILPNGQTYATARSVILILGVSQLILATFSICLSALNYSRYYIFSLLYSFILTVSAIILNQYLIPLYGIQGAAMSNLLSYALYFVLIVTTLYITMRTQPLSRNLLGTVLLLAAVLIINYLWTRYWPIDNIWVSSIVRSTVLGGSTLAIAYFAQLSPDLHALLHKIFV